MIDAIGIIGLGQFGKFWGTALAKNAPYSVRVYGFDANAEAEFPDCITKLSLAELCRLPLIFLCVPIRSMPQILQSIAPLLAPDTIVADACSVKCFPARCMREYLPESAPILTTHPMFGPESAKKTLRGLSIMLYPIRGTEAFCDELTEFFEQMGLRCARMTPEEHDYQAAYSQALTHLVGRTLNKMGVQETVIATRWYEALLSICRQVAKDSEALFEDMQNLNPFAPEMRASFEESYKSVLSELNNRGALYEKPLFNKD